MAATGENRFNVLVCIDGSDESYRGLRYATKFSLDYDDTDITLLYVRPADRGSASEGLNMSVTRENLLDWDMDLPGLKSLKKGRNLLVERGFLGEEWGEDDIEKRSRGSRLENHMISYTSTKTGQHITLMVRVATSVLAGILEEVRYFDYDIVIVSASRDDNFTHLGHIDLHTATTVATEHDGTVILARELEEGHGHFVCLTDSEDVETARKDAIIASRCGCPIYLYSVVENESDRAAAQEVLDEAETAIEALGIMVSGIDLDVGEPVRRIIEKGREHSLIVMSASDKSRIKRMFTGSISYDILKKARNSVMIIR